MAKRSWTILELLSEATSFMQGRGIDSPRVSAEVLLGHALGLGRVDLYARYDAPVESVPLTTFRELVRKRLDRVPLQYLTGKVEFYSRTFSVREGVFIPRPETEVLVDKALEALGKEGAARIAEIGVGSGAVLVTLLLERPDATAFGSDVSARALELAGANAAKHGVAERVAFQEGSLLDALRTLDEASLDLLLANPPYLSEETVATLAPEVKDHEPRAALIAAENGLAALRVIIDGAWSWLKPGGCLALEIGDTQGTAVQELFEASARYESVTLSRDFAGKDRVVVARTRGGE